MESASVWKDDVAWRGKEFRRLVSSQDIRHLRNVLEHAAEYLAGHGKYPEMVVSIDDDWPGFLGVNGRVQKIHVFGRQYEVEAVISAAFRLADVLPKRDQVGD